MPENPEKIELEPVSPAKYPEEIHELVKKLEEIKEGKAAEEPPVPSEIVEEKNEAIEEKKEVLVLPGNISTEVPEFPELKEEVEPAAEPVKEGKEEPWESEEAFSTGDPAEEEKKAHEEITRVERVGREMRGVDSEPVDPNFKVDQVINDKEFLDFLTNYPDAHEIDPNSQKREFERRFRVYEEQKALGQALLDFYKKEVSPKLDLPVDEKGEKNILKAIRKEAVENPDELIKKGQERVEYEGLKAELEKWDKQITAMGGAKNREEALANLEDLQKSLEKEKLTKKLSVGVWRFINPENNIFTGWFFRKLVKTSSQEQGWRKEILAMPRKDRRVFFKEIDGKIEALAGTRKEVEAWDEQTMRTKFDELRKEVFQKFEPAKFLFGWLQKKLVKTIHDLVQGKGGKEPSLKNLDEARKYIDRFKVGAKDFDFSDFDPLDMEAELDARLQKTVEALLHKHLAEVKITNKPLEDLMSGLQKIISSEKDSRGRDLVIGVIIQSLGKAIDSIKASNKDTAKLYLLRVAQHQLMESLNP